MTALMLSLAWFAAVNLLVSVAAWVIACVTAKRRLSQRSLVTLRLLPAAASVLFVGAIFLPAHWRFEPREIEESFGILVFVLAAAGALLVLRSLHRAANVASAAWQLRACAGLPRIASVDAGTTGVYEVQGLTGVSLAGVVRPRILVGPVVRRALTPAELDAAVAHEMAHADALDNVKRFVMFCAPDFFGQSAAARRIEAEWRAAAEWQADARAVRGDQCRAVHLASALVKVARLATTGPVWQASPSWSTLHDAPLLEMRVNRLVGGEAPRPERSRRARSVVAAIAVIASAIAAGTIGGAGVHQITEALAHLLL
jgi:hypothetical protein